MILFIFNNKFPENSGFGIRCKRAIDSLVKIEEVEILCRKDESNNKLVYKSGTSSVIINTFQPISPTIDLAINYIPGIYELIRNIDLMFQLGIQTIKLFYKNRNRDIKVYVVNSPLTVPLVVLILSKFFNVTLEIIEFHDLEPELALHIKKITKQSLVYRIEIYLEKLICRNFKKIIVTTNGQAERISKRAKVNLKNILVVPNLVQSDSLSTTNKSFVSKISKEDFNIGYFSSFSYRYTIEGINKFINDFRSIIGAIPNAKLILVGNGVGLETIKDNIAKNKLEENVIIITNHDSVYEYLKMMDICLIPWIKDDMTETMLPTKLFQYMSVKQVVIAPNFGEFKRVLQNNKDALLFDSMEDCILKVLELKKDKLLCNNLSKNLYNKFINDYDPKDYSVRFLHFIKQ